MDQAPPQLQARLRGGLTFQTPRLLSIPEVLFVKPPGSFLNGSLSPSTETSEMI